MMTESAPSTAPLGRPIPITIICVLCAIGALFAVPMVFSEAARAIGAWYPPYLTVGVVVGGASMVGFWLMRRWALYLYTAVLVVNQIVLLTMGVWNVFGLIIPAIIVAIGFAYFARMR